MSVLDVFRSKGVKRTLAVLCLLAAQAPVPVLAPFQPMLLSVATGLGAVGIVHAGLDKAQKVLDKAKGRFSE